jgi:hypothetical protein
MLRSNSAKALGRRGGIDCQLIEIEVDAASLQRLDGAQ